MKQSHARIYVCHTFYHAYIAFLKELALPEDKHGDATLVLSLMSNNFNDFKERAMSCGLWEDVIEYDEKRETFFPELAKWKKDKGSFIKNSFSRIVFTHEFAKLQERYVPVNFKDYGEVYVFCDLDPIGLYLSQKHIKYHALEDGLDSLKIMYHAYLENKSHFKLKAFMSEVCNLIFIGEGFNKYCIDMEVNDIASIRNDGDCKKLIEVPRQELAARLTDEDKEILLKAFVPDYDSLITQIEKLPRDARTILILTEPLCDLSTRERLFRDLINRYSSEGLVFIKPHPRDELNYRTLFSDVPQFEGSMPMEILNLFKDFRFSKVVSVYTQLGEISFAAEKERLGKDFMDAYEDVSVHAHLTE